jgi:hypothetical protein
MTDIDDLIKTEPLKILMDEELLKKIIADPERVVKLLESLNIMGATVMVDDQPVMLVKPVTPPNMFRTG